tara:strand:+ start:1147 stop:1626 length:480 start_codon:yes stop_codon:yes gene_type:complete
MLFNSCVENRTLKTENQQTEINNLLDNWHKNAAETNFEAYFDAMTDDAIFIGTDATENWNKEAFMAFSKPYFNNGKAWNFTSLQRNVYFSIDDKTAWFDELLDTQMKICRGSGVLEKLENEWKIKHYVLSMTVPNENTTEVVKIKSAIEDAIIKNKKAL